MCASSNSAAPAMPRAEFEERIGAEQQHERPLVASSCAQLGERVEGVARSGAPRLAIVHAETLVPCDGELRHRNAVVRLCAGTRAMGRRPAGHESHLRELRTFGNFFGETQVPVVDRVERAAEDTDGAGAARQHLVKSVRQNSAAQARCACLTKHELPDVSQQPARKLMKRAPRAPSMTR